MTHTERPGLWTIASNIWRAIAAQWGTPAEIAAHGCFGYYSRRDIQDWLRHLELLVRRLVLAAALAFDPGPPSARALRTSPQRERRRFILWPDKPEGWRARLHIMPRAPTEHSQCSRNADPRRSGVFDAWPSALRLQALFVVIENPRPRVLRLARMLARIRTRNVSANAPRQLGVRHWPPRGKVTPALRAVYDAMWIIQPASESAFARWQPPEPD